MPRQISKAAPQLPVRKCEEAGIFLITAPPRYDPDSKFGEGWSVRIADCVTGELAVLLFTGNKVRDLQMSDLITAFNDSNEPVGPCKLEKIDTATAGRKTWQIVDADDLSVSTAKTQRATVRN